MLQYSLQHSFENSYHYHYLLCWTTCYNDMLMNPQQSLNMNPHQVDSVAAHHRCQTFHIWHTFYLRSSPPDPPLGTWVEQPSACGSCRFLTRIHQSADQSQLCSRSNSDRSLPSHPVFSETRSSLLRQCACHSKHWSVLYHQDQQSTLHSDCGQRSEHKNSLDLTKFVNNTVNKRPRISVVFFFCLFSREIRGK